MTASDAGTHQQHFKLCAYYNHWFNERLYGVCETLSEPVRRLERGAFFGLIHGTLNHILWGDRFWLGRFSKSS